MQVPCQHKPECGHTINSPSVDIFVVKWMRMETQCSSTIDNRCWLLEWLLLGWDIGLLQYLDLQCTITNSYWNIGCVSHLDCKIDTPMPFYDVNLYFDVTRNAFNGTMFTNRFLYIDLLIVFLDNFVHEILYYELWSNIWFDQSMVQFHPILEVWLQDSISYLYCIV